MKHIYSFLILIGGLIGLIGIVFFGTRIHEKIEYWEHHLDCRCGRYHRFKTLMNDKIMPWVAGIIMFGILALGLVAGYFMILEAL